MITLSPAPAAYTVMTLRSAGLEAMWGKTGGRPCLLARNPKSKMKHAREMWWIVDVDMWRSMNENPTPAGIVEAFENYVMLGDIFSI